MLRPVVARRRAERRQRRRARSPGVLALRRRRPPSRVERRLAAPRAAPASRSGAVSRAEAGRAAASEITSRSAPGAPWPGASARPARGPPSTVALAHAHVGQAEQQHHLLAALVELGQQPVRLLERRRGFVERRRRASAACPRTSAPCASAQRSPDLAEAGERGLQLRARLLSVAVVLRLLRARERDARPHPRVGMRERRAEQPARRAPPAPVNMREHGRDRRRPAGAEVSPSASSPSSSSASSSRAPPHRLVARARRRTSRRSARSSGIGVAGHGGGELHRRLSPPPGSPVTQPEPAQRDDHPQRAAGVARCRHSQRSAAIMFSRSAVSRREPLELLRAAAGAGRPPRRARRSDARGRCARRPSSPASASRSTPYSRRVSSIR